MERFRTPYALLAIILWLATAVVGLMSIALLREFLFTLVARFSVVGDNAYELYIQSQQAGVGGSLLAIFLGILYIPAFIGGIDYHSRHFGEPGAWRPLAIVMGAEAAFLLLVWLV